MPNVARSSALFFATSGEIGCKVDSAVCVVGGGEGDAGGASEGSAVTTAGEWKFSLVLERSPQPLAKIEMPAKKMSSGRVNLILKGA
jgi:hypothetical protein